MGGGGGGGDVVRSHTRRPLTHRFAITTRFVVYLEIVGGSTAHTDGGWSRGTDAGAPSTALHLGSFFVLGAATVPPLGVLRVHPPLLFSNLTPFFYVVRLTLFLSLSFSLLPSPLILFLPA